jgi:hypothetical protein
MRKRLLILAALVLAALGAAWAVQFHQRSERLARGRLIDREHCDRIKKGMTQAEVEAVLGAPPGDYAARPGFVVGVEREGDNQGPRSETWRADGAQLRVVFDGQGKVQGKVYILATVTREPSLAERVRDWFRGLWP